MTELKHDRKYIRYVDDVLSNKIVTGNYIKLACKRFMDFMNRDDIYFDYNDVDRKIRFVERMKMTKGLLAGQQFILLPFQAWIFASIFGFKWKKDNLRVTRQVLIMISRQMGKSFLCASIALTCLLCDDEPSPSISFIANSAKQAEILFGHCRSQATTLDPKNKIFRMLRQNIFVDKIDGSINVLSSDTNKLDGRSDSCCILDEQHAQKSTEQWNIIRTGQGSRRQPLMISCTTAGFLVGDQYPLYSMWKNCVKILLGEVEDDSWFSAIYMLDEGDDWKAEENWIKAGPSLGSAVKVDFLREQILGAKNNPRLEYSIKTKNLNCWCQSAKAWFTLETIDNIFKYKIDESRFAGDNCYMGLDLSKSSDLTAFALLFPPDENRDFHPEKFIFKPYVYIPDIAVEKSTNKEFYKVWLRDGYAISSAGNVIDYDQILRDMVKSQEDFNLLLAAYDPWRAPLLVTNAEKAGLPMAPFKQSRTNFSKVIDCFEMLANSGNILIDKSPLVKWSLNNVEISEDKFGNMLCEKANGDPAAKIDPIMACLMALGAYLSENQFDPMIYTL